MQFNGAACPGAFSNSAHPGSIFSSLRSSQLFPLATSGLSNRGASLLTDGLIYPVPVYGDVNVTNGSQSNMSRFTTKVDDNERSESVH